MALTSQITTSLLQVDGRMTEGGVIEIVPGARLLLDVGVENVEPGALLDEIATAVAEAQAARDEAQAIAGIDTVVEALTVADADPDSDFRQQQDARLTATFVARERLAAAATASQRLARAIGILSEPARTVTVGAAVAEAAATTASLGPATITAADDRITVPTPHGLVPGDVIFLFGHAGSNLASQARYWVEATPTTTSFTTRSVSTPGTAQNITADGTATAVYKRARGYDRDAAVANPLLRVLGTTGTQAATSGAARDYLVADPTAVTYAPGSLVGNYLTVEAEVSGTRYVDVVVRNDAAPGKGRIWVDGRLASEVDLVAAGIGVGAVARIPLTFDSTDRHLIRYESASTAQHFVGFDVGSLGRLTYPASAAPKGPKVMLVGDSFMDGAASSGSTAAKDVAWWLARCMGWQDVHRSAAGSTGYLADGSRQSLVDRYAADVIAKAPDQVVIALGVNDKLLPDADVVTAATTVWDAIRTSLPLTSLTIVGPWPTSGGTGSQDTGLDSALQAAAESRGLRYVSPIQQGVTFGLADTIHPNPAGHQKLGAYISGWLA